MSIRRSAVATFVAGLLAVPLFAASQPDVSVAEVQVTPGAIQWKVLVPSDLVTLTVSGPDGETITKESKSQNVNVTLHELGALDGTYTYQLVVTPPIPADFKEKIKKARANNDDKGTRKLMRDAGLDRPLAQSGALTVINGALVSPTLQEGSNGPKSAATSASSETDGRNSASANPSILRLRPRPEDQVIPDDLIVQSSLCVGFDCVVNESFGFDTIRLKENSTRIKFEDTSVGSFPTTDWMLTANDSASGGANKFSVEDITGVKVPFTILGGATTNSIFVSSNGKVGFRTSTPGLDLHMATSDTPAIRFEQNSSGGFTAQTWDIGANEANFFVRDLTGGSRLPFRVRPGAPTSSIDIAATGNVGVGTASPRSILDVKPQAVGAGLGLLIDDGTYGVFTFGGNSLNFDYSRNATSAGFLNYAGYQGGFSQFRNLFIGNGKATAIAFFEGSTGFLGLGTSTPTAPIEHSTGAKLTAGGVWQNASSRDMKLDIKDIDATSARKTVMTLEPVTFAYRVDPKEHHAGFIAEDVPDMVASTDRKSLSPMDIVAVLTKVVQEQQKTIDALSQRLEQLENVNH